MRSNIISMWSGPRNISTTMMRAFENRPDTAVYDEPFYGVYLSKTGAPHPCRDEILTQYPTTDDNALAWINEADHPFTFCKHIAYHFVEPTADGAASMVTPHWFFDWIEQHRTILLIRDPRRMVASFKNKYDDVAPIAQSYALMLRIFEHLSGMGHPCPIVDAQDILAAPGPMLASLCETLDIPFTAEIAEHMQSWPNGRRSSDGPWAAHWYDVVENSTGFRQAPAAAPPVLTPDLESAAALSTPAYELLHERRLRI